MSNVDSTNFKNLKARIESYENLKKEFYTLNINDKNIDKYIELFQQFNDEFLDASGEIGVTVSGVSSMTNDQISQLIQLARTFIGHTYKWGADGTTSDSVGLCFDCSGFVTYLLKTLGIMPSNVGRLTVSTIPNSGYFYEVSWDNKQAGDVLINNNSTHVVIYEGDNQIIHASNSKPYPQGGVKEQSLYFTGKAYRIKGLGVE